MIRLAPMLLAAALLGCAELRQPPPGQVPPGLGVVSPDPVPAMAAEAARAFAESGRAFAGNPAATARAVGQAELVAAELRRDPRWAALPPSVGGELRPARLEWRAALGIRSGAAPDAVAAALGRAALALREGDTRRAAAALDPALFEPGGVVTLARLAAPGPLPQGTIATRAAQQQIDQLAQARVGGLSGALDPDTGILGGLSGSQTLPQRY
jgi:hypothetical protein